MSSELLQRLKQGVAENDSQLRRLRGLLSSLEEARARTSEQLASTYEDALDANRLSEEENTNPPRALVVDDDPITQVLLSAFLNDEGFHVEVSSNGSEGVQAALRFRPDIIFMDFEMPVMNGAEASRSLRARTDLTPRPFIIAFTGANQFDIQEICERAGMDDFLPKPFDRARIQRALNRWKATRG